MTRFNPSSGTHRHAIWTIHNEKCYLCDEPIPFNEVEIDHIIPKSIHKQPDQLVRAKESFGLSKHFEINGFENLLPACRRCNRLKKDNVPNYSGLTTMHLEMASKKADKVKSLIAKTKSNRKIDQLLVELQSLSEEGLLTSTQHELIRSFSQYQVSIRVPELRDSPVQVTRTIQIPITQNASTKDTYSITIGGPFVLSIGPQGPSFRGPAICKHCGGRSFNGEACASCGRVQ
jgi:hypothetical protein